MIENDLSLRGRNGLRLLTVRNRSYTILCHLQLLRRPGKKFQATNGGRQFLSLKQKFKRNEFQVFK